MVEAHYDGRDLFVDGKVVPKPRHGGDNSKRASITSVTFPAGLHSIGNYAFSGCLLNSVGLPEGLQSIGNSAFSGCYLFKITFPVGLKRIGDGAFSGCLLNSVTFPEGLQSIGVRAFSGCRLTSVVLPHYNIRIDRHAFSGCARLESLSLASGHSCDLPYYRLQHTILLRVAVLLCLSRLRLEYYGDDYEAVESRGTTPATGTLEGRLAFQMIACDDLWRYTLEFVGPEVVEES